jgi:DNA sulfur modification protein DndB
MSKYENLHPSYLDEIIKNPGAFWKDKVSDEDSPVSIDSMISIQNSKLMFVSSVKIGTLVGLLETEDPRLSLPQRRQRRPDFSRIPPMAEYLHGKPWAYSAITVALSGKFEFEPLKKSNGTSTRLGILKIPRGFKSRAVIIDGQHRFYSLRAALGLEPNYLRYSLPYEKQQILAEENISVIFYVFENDSEGVNWSQQYFHDLNCLGVSTSRSLGIRFDKRNPLNILTLKIAERANPFVGRIEFEETQCGSNNPNLFTLSALKNANRYLLDDVKSDNLTEKYDIALKYWNEIGNIFECWNEMPGFEIRDQFVHGYGVILSSLGLLGKHLIEPGKDYEESLHRLKGLDWARWNHNKDGSLILSEDGKKVGNPFWNGFALNGATVQNTTSNIRHTALLLRRTLGLKLENDENTILSSIRTGIN